MKRAILSAAVVLILSAFPLSAQRTPLPSAPAPVEAVPPAPTVDTDAVSRRLLAISNERYPVTPGDSYRVTYLQAGNVVSFETVVQSDYRLNLNLFGTLEARGLTFTELRPAVIRRVTAAYPQSIPSLDIVSLGLFEVLVRGEVPATRHVKAWGLSRLSDVVTESVGNYSSLREIQVLDRGGQSTTYDLFQARRFGRVDQDPYVRPGDTVVIARREREVEVQGEVLHPGTYQLLAGEGFEELIRQYGGGYTRLAHTSRIKIERIDDQRARTFYVDPQKEYRSLGLQDGDRVTVLSKISSLPIVFFEGAVAWTGPAAPELPAARLTAREQALDPSRYNRITHDFKPGQTLSDALLLQWESISPFADLARSYIIREGFARPIPVDLQVLRDSYSPDRDIPLEPYDRIIIPAKQFFVSVSGSVDNPGLYPYVPNRLYAYYLNQAGVVNLEESSSSILITDAEGHIRGVEDPVQPEDRIRVTPAAVSVFGAVMSQGQYPFLPGQQYMYYLKLAGGINPTSNTGDVVRILDVEGVQQPRDYVLKPGDRIYVPNNRFVDNFNRYFPLISSSVAFLTAIITLINVLGP